MSGKHHRVYYIAIGIAFLYLLVLVLAKQPAALYGDGGLMFLQTRDLVMSDYSTFAFDYPGEEIDPEFSFVPFRKPFLDFIAERPYIDFPPYFPAINSPLYHAFGKPGLYIWNVVGLIASMVLMGAAGRTLGFSAQVTVVTLLLYGFACTVCLYVFYFHEYSVALALVHLSIFFAARSFKSEASLNYAFWFGLAAGTSLFFRLETVFTLAAVGALVWISKRFEWRWAVLSLVGLSIPFAALLFLNQEIHGHPLGLRYVLTIEATEATIDMEAPAGTEDPMPSLIDPIPGDGLSRSSIVYGMLLHPRRGLFYQSPFIAVGLVIAVLVFVRRSRGRSNEPREVDRVAAGLLACVLVAGILILLFAPNDGDHFAPRYLFALIVPALFGTVHFTLEFLYSIKARPLRIAASSFLALLVLWSVVEWARNGLWLFAVENQVVEANKTLEEYAKGPIVFLEYASPQQLSTTYANRVLFVADTSDKLSALHRGIFESGDYNTYTISIPVLGTAGRQTLAHISPNNDETIDYDKLKEVAPALNGIPPQAQIDIDAKEPFLFLYVNQ